MWNITPAQEQRVLEYCLDWKPPKFNILFYQCSLKALLGEFILLKTSPSNIFRLNNKKMKLHNLQMNCGN